MTEQVPDVVRVAGQELRVQDFLSFPLGEVPGVVRVGPPAHDSSCWRGYVATWELRDGRLWLVALQGQLALAGERPLLASWVGGLYRLPLGRVRSRPRPGPRARERGRARVPAGEARPRQLLELELEEGVVLRQRQVLPGRGAAGSPWWEAAHWTRLPGAAGLFTRRARKDPDEGRPQAHEFLGLHLREACALARHRAGLSHGDVMERTGRKRAAGGALAEWERGQRRCDAAWVRSVCDAVGLAPAERAALEAREHAELEAAFARWQAQPLRPQLTLVLDPDLEDFGQVTYEAPEPACASEAAALAWAQACCTLAWRPGTLRLSRAEVVRLDGHGRSLERIALGPRREP